MRQVLQGIILLSISGCIGTDFIDDPIVGESIEIISDQSSVLVGESVSVSANYFDLYGIEQQVNFDWQSADQAIATVDSEGQISGIESGTTQITASFNSIQSQPFNITVVSSLSEVASVSISFDKQNLFVGESITLEAVALNIQDDTLNDKTIVWTSTDMSVASLTQEGVISGLANGVTEVYASSDDVESERVEFSVGPQERTGTFQGINGYSAVGSVVIAGGGSEDVTVRLSDNFSTDFALGTFLYLSNSTSGSATRADGLNLGELEEGNIQTEFNVTDIDTSVDINTYDYVIVLCRPAGITFGFAELD